MRGVPAVLTLWCWVLGGCFTYRPLGEPRPEPAMYLAVTLTDAGSEELSRYIGPDVGVVRGRFQSAGERGLTLAVAQVELHRGDVLAWRGETVIVPRAFVSSVEQRHVSGGRTALLVGASALALVVTYHALGSGSDATMGSGGSGRPR